MSKNIHIINVKTDDVSSNYNYFFLSGNSPLSNPFKYTGKRSNASKLTFKTREECIIAYRKYFELCYGQPGYEAMTYEFDKIYEHYKNGEEIYLGCFCSPLPCHCDVIAEELEKKILKEKMNKNVKH